MRPNRNKDKRKRPNEEASVVIDLTKEPDEPTTKKSKTDDHNKRQSQSFQKARTAQGSSGNSPTRVQGTTVSLSGSQGGAEQIRTRIETSDGQHAGLAWCADRLLRIFAPGPGEGAKGGRDADRAMQCRP